MSGWIIPAPLATPVTVIGVPSIVTRRDVALGTVSVVMIAFAAASHPSLRTADCAAGSEATTRSTGNGSMITPVENGSTCSAVQPTRRAALAQVARAASSPCSPVPALALPALITSARKSSRRSCCAWRCARQITTGAAQKRFCVKTPAAIEPGSATISTTSSRIQLLIFAAAVPRAMPGTGNSDSGFGGARRTGTQPSRPWQCLYFFPLPHGHRSFRPTFCPARTNGGGGAIATAVSPLPLPALASASS